MTDRLPRARGHLHPGGRGEALRLRGAARPLPTIDAVFARGRVRASADYGVVPVENSTEGMVTHTLDNFVGSTLKICGEVELPIRHHLLGAPGYRRGKRHAHLRPPAGARAVPQLAGEELAAYRAASRRRSNGEAARLAAADPDDRRDRRRHGARGLRPGDAGRAASRTTPTTPRASWWSGARWSSPAAATRPRSSSPRHNKPGALFKLLEPFQREQLMLTRIDTRPSRSAALDLPLLHRVRGAPGRPQGGGRAGRAGGADGDAEDPGLLSPGSDLRP